MHLEGEYTHPYKFDVKARLAVTHQRGLIVDLGYRGNSEMAERVSLVVWSRAVSADLDYPRNAGRLASPIVSTGLYGPHRIGYSSLGRW